MPIVFPVLISESLMNVPGIAELLKPVTVPAVLLAVHIKSVPATLDVNVMFVLVFEQIGAFGGVVSNGTGYTVTT